MIFRQRLFSLSFVVVLILGLNGCTFGANQSSEEQRQRDEKIWLFSKGMA